MKAFERPNSRIGVPSRVEERGRHQGALVVEGDCEGARVSSEYQRLAGRDDFHQLIWFDGHRRRDASAPAADQMPAVPAMAARTTRRSTVWITGLLRSQRRPQGRMVGDVGETEPSLRKGRAA